MRRPQQDKIIECCERAARHGMLYRCANPAEARAARKASERLVLTEPLLRRFTVAQTWSALPEPERLRMILTSVALDHPAWALCSISAAYLMGFTDSYWYHSQVHMAVPHNARGTYTPKYVAKHTIPDEAPTPQVCGIRMVTPERVLLECAQDLPFEESLPIWDNALRRQATTPQRIAHCVECYSNHVGVCASRLLLRYANPASESGGESAARAAILKLGFQEPQLQRVFRNPNDGKKLRTDFFWNLDFGRKIAGEFDGMRKYKDEAILQGRNAEDVIIAEKDRETALNALGVMVVRFGWDAVHEPGILEQQLARMGVPKVGERELLERQKLAQLRGRMLHGTRLSLRGV
ncbi:MAG: hypothetical protein PUF51_01785 [Bifidobacteriaceae bacterium]|nr:hypothetical protein [Bifidobacteriaceae bacterium]